MEKISPATGELSCDVSVHRGARARRVINIEKPLAGDAGEISIRASATRVSRAFAIRFCARRDNARPLSNQVERQGGTAAP